MATQQIDESSDFITGNIAAYKAKIAQLKIELASWESLPKVNKCNCGKEKSVVCFGGDLATFFIYCDKCKRQTAHVKAVDAIAEWNKMASAK